MRIQSTFTSSAAALGASALVLLGFVWMVTYGTFELFDPENFGRFYDAQATSLLAGHWDVPAKEIFPEGFFRDGKVYGYFGFVPALPRMALNTLFPGMYGAWSRFSMTVACAGTLFFCHRILRRARQWRGASGPPTAPEQAAGAGFLMLAGLGSCTIYLGSRAFIYHEAIIWAGVLALACYDQILAYLLDAKIARLIVACLLAFLCFFCRISTGCGPFVTLLLLGMNLLGLGIFRRLNRWTVPPGLMHGGMIVVALLVITVSYFSINRIKFGRYFDPAPMQLHEQVIANPGRFEKTNGRWLRLGNVPTVAYAYLSPGSIIFRPGFPWVYLQDTMRLFPGQRMDGWGPFSSVTASMPVFLVLACVGVISASRRQKARSAQTESGKSPAILFIGALAPIGVLLLFSSVDNRYLHDFFPFFVVAGAFGLHALLAIRRPGIRSLLAGTFITLGLFQIYANCSFALVYQRLWVFGRPEKAERQMLKWQRAVDGRVDELLTHFHSNKLG